VVSEETGRIAITNDGRMIPKLDVKRLRTILNAFYGEERNQSDSPLGQLRERGQRLLTALRERRKQA
jgi:hypothetical protein